MRYWRVSSIRKTVLSFFLLISTTLATASSSTAQPQLSTFQPGSYQTIIKHYQGQPFLMVLWSLDCPPCFHELAMLGNLLADYPALNLVLVSTDSPNSRKELLSVINSKGVSSADIWVFSQANASRLRFEVDRVWYGELPRSYFFDDQHNRRAISGVLKREAVVEWLQNIQ